MITITLPWPDRELSANARDRWGRIKAAKYARYAGAVLARSQGITDLHGAVTIVVTFHPPTKSRTDIDNMVSMLKPWQDGIFDGLGQDDRIIAEARYIRGDKLPGGSVVYRIYGRGEMIPDEIEF